MVFIAYKSCWNFVFHSYICICGQVLYIGSIYFAENLMKYFDCWYISIFRLDIFHAGIFSRAVKMHMDCYSDILYWIAIFWDINDDNPPEN